MRDGRREIPAFLLIGDLVMAQKPPAIVTARKPLRANQSKLEAEVPAMPQRIVTVRKPGLCREAASDLSTEELQRRRDAVDELFRNIVRRVTNESRQ